MSFEVADEDDAVRTLLDIADRHGMRLASMLTFRHPGGHGGDGLRVGVARLLGPEPPELVDDIWASCSRVRRILRDETRGTEHARPSSARPDPGAMPLRTGRR